MSKETRTYKNVSGRDLDVIGVGVVKAGETIQSHAILNTPNLELVSQDAKKEKEAPKAEADTKKSEGKSGSAKPAKK